VGVYLDVQLPNGRARLTEFLEDPEQRALFATLKLGSGDRVEIVVKLPSSWCVPRPGGVRLSDLPGAAGIYWTGTIRNPRLITVLHPGWHGLDRLKNWIQARLEGPFASRPDIGGLVLGMVLGRKYGLTSDLAGPPPGAAAGFPARAGGNAHRVGNYEPARSAVKDTYLALQIPDATVRVPSPPTWVWLAFGLTGGTLVLSIHKRWRSVCWTGMAAVLGLQLLMMFKDFSPTPPRVTTLTFLDVGQEIPRSSSSLPATGCWWTAGA
jgi:hypothetical protein